jgi:hypothetical protein
MGETWWPGNTPPATTINNIFSNYSKYMPLTQTYFEGLVGFKHPLLHVSDDKKKCLLLILFIFLTKHTYKNTE